MTKSGTPPPGERIGEMLLREGLIDRAGLTRALEDARATGHRLGYSLVRLGLLSERDLALCLARQHHVSAIDLERVQLDAALLELIPAEVALRSLVIPIRRVGRMLVVAMADPGDMALIEDLKFLTRCDIEPVIAGEFVLRRIVEREYDSADERMTDLLRAVDAEAIEFVEEREEEPGPPLLEAQIDEAPVVKLINGILHDAVRRGASDIHFECYEREIRVRYRIDGTLVEIMRPPIRMRAALISRFKILSDLDIAERRLPQDGRLRIRIGRRLIDFRLSTLPTLFGEKIVLRILDRGNLTLELEKFGMEPRAEQNFLRAIRSPYGMVLVTGPTGSGKTTTLYSALAELNSAGVNILTAEDPVEYNIAGINQVQMRPDIGLTFSTALRAFLRQDPNVIMVGEIRDTETGAIAVKAALTGHLVLATVHTNDAPSTITRLVDMGIEPFNVASAVTLITAQRLVRRICDHCREPAAYPDEYLLAAGLGSDGDIEFQRGAGCAECGGSGYRGRQGLYEVMAMSPGLRRMVLQGASADELRAQAVSEGMLSLRMDGLRKAQRGITTLEEVVRETVV